MTDIGATAGRAVAAGAAGFAAGGPIGALVGVASQVVPEIIKALAGDDAGEAAVQVAEAVQVVAGTTDPMAAAAVIQGDAAKAMELRTRLLEIQVAAEEKRRAAELETLRLEIQGQENARRQTVQLAQIGSSLAWMPAVQTFLVSFAFIGTLMALLFNVSGLHRMGDGVREVLMILVGILAAEFRGACQYWIGGSRAGGLAATAGLQQAATAMRGMGQQPRAATPAAAPAAPVAAAPEVATRRPSLFSRST